MMAMQTSNTTLPDLNSSLSFFEQASPIPQLTTLDVFHDCNRIAWYWAATLSGTGGSAKEERGVSLIYTIDGAMADQSDGVVESVSSVLDGYGGRKVNMLMWEFDSLGWSELN